MLKKTYRFFLSVSLLLFACSELHEDALTQDSTREVESEISSSSFLSDTAKGLNLQSSSSKYPNISSSALCKPHLSDLKMGPHSCASFFDPPISQQTSSTPSSSSSSLSSWPISSLIEETRPCGSGLNHQDTLLQKKGCEVWTCWDGFLHCNLNPNQPDCPLKAEAYCKEFDSSAWL